MENKNYVILIYPKTGMDLGSTIAPPHSILSVAAPLEKAGYKVQVIDQRTTNSIEEDLSTSIKNNNILFVGISSMTGTQVNNAIFIATIVRKINDKIPIVWGGPHPTVVPEQTAKHELVDYVVVGEAEETIVEFSEALQLGSALDNIKGLVYYDGDKLTNTGVRPLVDIEILLPVPWHLIDVEKYIHKDMYVNDRYRVMDIGQTSRGCPFSCGFCSSASIRGRKWRSMSAKKSIEMITDTVKRFKLDGFWLRDDEFYINRKRADDICRGIIENKLDISFYTSGTRVDVFLKATDEEIENLKKAGAHTLKFGAESGSQRVLDLMNKGITPEQTLEVNRKCKRLGITPAFALVIGYPTETFEDINMTIDLAFRLKKENPDAQLETMAQFTALPGTPSYNLAVQHGLKPTTTLDQWGNWIFDDYDFSGDKLPWYTKKERISIGNISYMSILSNALLNAVGSISNPLIRIPLTILAYPSKAYFGWRLKNKYYKFVPELQIVRWLRYKIFYNAKSTIS